VRSHVGLEGVGGVKLTHKRLARLGLIDAIIFVGIDDRLESLLTFICGRVTRQNERPVNSKPHRRVITLELTSPALGNLVSGHDNCHVVFTSGRKGSIHETLTRFF